MKIIFNHNYYLKHDSERTILATNPYAQDINVKNGWLSKIHPFYAMIFSLLSQPMEIEDAIKKIAYFFSIKATEAESLITPFLNESGVVEANYQNTTSYFPPNIILKWNADMMDYSTNYTPSQFVFSHIDLTSSRMKVAPQGIVLIINNHCATNCIYCYADKTHKCIESPSLSTINNLLKNAQKLGIRELQTIGGEFFLYPEWEQLLKMSQEYGFFQPLISTKIPLNKEQIDVFKQFNIRLQISLDAFDSGTLQKTLRVSDSYLERIKETIINVDKASINFQIATVLTKETASLENINSLYSFFKLLKNIKRWEIRLAFRSLYSSSNFDKIKVPEEFISILTDWYNEISKVSTINIVLSPNVKSKYFSATKGSISFEGPRCSANLTHMVILPDGLVTICEQLYWNPRFIIGDIYKNTIEEIWTGKRAMELAGLQQSEIQKDSPCSSCELFDTCSKYPNKCYVNTIKAYGDDKWDYPDPRCSRALPFINLL